MTPALIDSLNAFTPLTEEQASACLKEIFKGDIPIDDLIRFLDTLSSRDVTTNEIVGFAKVMRKALIPVHLDLPAIDVCGTGGSGKDRFNISTCSAFALAAAKVPVAKHGNRGSSKPNGSFDFLEALGINIDLNAQRVEALFKQQRLAFIFARLFHPSMKIVGPARQRLGKRTIFNLLGPLCNPASVPYQIIGTTDLDTGKKLAEATQRLGTRHALIIVGGDGLDELSLESPSTLFEVTDVSIETFQFDPEGLTQASKKDYDFSNVKANADLFLELLADPAPHEHLVDQIALNAGAALYCAGHSETIREGHATIKELFLTGMVRLAFEDYRRASGVVPKVPV